MATQPVVSDPFAVFMAEFRACNDAQVEAASVDNYWEGWPVVECNPVAVRVREERCARDSEIAERFHARLLAASDPPPHEQMQGAIDGRSQSYLARLAMLLVDLTRGARPSPHTASLRTALAAFAREHAWPDSEERTHNPPNICAPSLASSRALTLLAAPCAPPRTAHVLGVCGVSDPDTDWH